MIFFVNQWGGVKVLEVFDSAVAENAGQTIARHIADQFTVTVHRQPPVDNEDLPADAIESPENSERNYSDATDDEPRQRIEPEASTP